MSFLQETVLHGQEAASGLRGILLAARQGVAAQALSLLGPVLAQDVRVTLREVRRAPRSVQETLQVDELAQACDALAAMPHASPGEVTECVRASAQLLQRLQEFIDKAVALAGHENVLGDDCENSEDDDEDAEYSYTGSEGESSSDEEDDEDDRWDESEGMETENGGDTLCEACVRKQVRAAVEGLRSRASFGNVARGEGVAGDLGPCLCQGNAEAATVA